MKKLATLVLCALMLFSAVMPVTTLAKTKKCTHKNTTWVTTSKATCTATGIKVKKCKNCGKILKTKKIAKTAHTYKSKTFTKATYRAFHYRQQCSYNNCLWCSIQLCSL